MKTTYKLILSALFLAIGIILPFFTGQITQIGNMLLPMHIPVFLCGFICGWQYGGLVGFITPLLRSFLFGAPMLYPNALSMCIELMAYGAISGLIYSLFKRKNVASIYLSMLPAMIVGRIMWGLMQVILLGFKDMSFSWTLFIGGAFLNAIPGIIIQLALIPLIISAIHYGESHKLRRVEHIERANSDCRKNY